MNKEKYMPPAIQVIQMEPEGIMAASSLQPGGGVFNSSHYSGDTFGSTRISPATSDFEEMINDILTIEE